MYSEDFKFACKRYICKNSCSIIPTHLSYAKLRKLNLNKSK